MTWGTKLQSLNKFQLITGVLQFSEKFFCTKHSEGTELFSTIRKPNIVKKDYLTEYGKYVVECMPKYIQKVQIMSGDELEILISPNGLLPLTYFLKNHHNAQFTQLVNISGIDVPCRKYRFELCYDFLSLRYNARVRLKTYTDELTPIDSVNEAYRSANWFEREIWDMYGVFFANHPDLRRILTDYGFDGFPQRRDFPLSGYVEVRFDCEKKRVVCEPIELAQEFRKFDLSFPWEMFPKFRKEHKEEHGGVMYVDKKQ